MPAPLRPALAVLSVLALACARPAAAAEPPGKTPSAAPAEKAPLYDPDLVGDQAIAAYQKAANDSGRRFLLNLGSNDCPACVVFNQALHKDKFFDVFSQQFVTLEVDVSNMPNAVLLDRYLINPKAELPAILIFMPDGRLIEALAHGEMAALSKKGVGAVQEWILARFAKSE